ncbi:MAG TPA: hypothetical protein VFX33_16205 [Actinomycetales bacterium]|nr:hypothetical protein [Actinomycetales bacterium]
MPGSGELQPVLEALKTVAVALKEAEVPFALAGGCAVYARGGPDSRHDVDFVIREGDREKVWRSLEERGLETIDPPEDWLFKARVAGEQVDLIFRLAMGPVDDCLLGRADQLTVDSVEMPVLAATDLLLGRLLAITEQSCDLSPVLALIRSLREQLDVDRIDTESSGHPFAEAAIDLARRLDLLPPRSGAGRRQATDSNEGDD